MNRQIGMRIPPKLGADGIESLAKWASSIGIDVIDVPYFNEEVKTALEKNGLEVGSIDGLGAVGQTKLLSSDEKVRLQAVESINAQFSEI
ncbi:sugar phosphate isomerase/epimerase family protein, partial [Metabacillus halosaccharovorans]